MAQNRDLIIVGGVVALIAVVGVGIALSKKAEAVPSPPMDPLPPGVEVRPAMRGSVKIEIIDKNFTLPDPNQRAVLAKLVNTEDFPIEFTNIFEVIGPSGIITTFESQSIVLNSKSSEDILFIVDLIEGKEIGTVYNWQILNQIASQDQTPVSSPKSGSFVFR